MGPPGAHRTPKAIYFPVHRRREITATPHGRLGANSCPALKALGYRKYPPRLEIPFRFARYCAFVKFSWSSASSVSSLQVMIFAAGLLTMSCQIVIFCGFHVGLFPATATSTSCQYSLQVRASLEVRVTPNKPRKPQPNSNELPYT